MNNPRYPAQPGYPHAPHHPPPRRKKVRPWMLGAVFAVIVLSSPVARGSR